MHQKEGICKTVLRYSFTGFQVASQAFKHIGGLIVSGGDSMNDGEFIEHRLGVVRQNLSVFDDPFYIDLITASHELPPPMIPTHCTTRTTYT